jgi:tRNA pseudouridine38-40 synthase
MTTRFRARVSYDGTSYAGWQIQPAHATVQGEMEKAIRFLTGGHVRVYCSGRTDQGVHGRGQVVHFDLAGEWTASKLLRGLNAKLPEDIRVEALRRAPADFDARFSATGKEYRYFIWDGPVMPACFRLYKVHVRRRLDVSAMNAAAAHLAGRHDFASFSANPNREVDGTVRTLRSLRVKRTADGVAIVARGDGFLYKMVRSLAGFLIRVGLGDLAPEDAPAILKARKRTATVPTAPPQGLFLWKVSYSSRRFGNEHRS